MKPKSNANHLRFIIQNSRDMDKVDFYMQAHPGEWMSAKDVTKALKFRTVPRTRKILNKLCDKWNKLERTIRKSPNTKSTPVTVYRWK